VGHRLRGSSSAWLIVSVAHSVLRERYWSRGGGFRILGPRPRGNDPHYSLTSRPAFRGAATCRPVPYDAGSTTGDEVRPWGPAAEWFPRFQELNGSSGPGPYCWWFRRQFARSPRGPPLRLSCNVDESRRGGSRREDVAPNQYSCTGSTP